MTRAFRPGDVLADRYRLVDLLVESGSGRFWRAHDIVLDRHVALHTIAADDGRSQALLDAARASTTVVDRRILRVLDAAVLDRVCYVVNEWGSGVSLDILIGGGQVLHPRHAAWLVAQVAATVARGHAAGIAHGRLAPENVLIDRHGEVRVIGFCVDAALHGVPFDRTSTDVADLAGLLYCALTGTWAGASRSDVRRAPREHGHVLRPRRVRAGVPRPLDQMCNLVLHPHASTRGQIDVSAAGIEEHLREFVGDDAGVPEALVATLPPVRERFPVSLPPVPDPRPHDDQPDEGDPADDEGEPADDEGEPVDDGEPTQLSPVARPVEEDTATRVADPDPTGAGTSPPERDRRATAGEVPTETALPSLDYSTGQTGQAGGSRSSRPRPGPPPPPLPDPPARPLFAPEPADGGPVRRPRHPTQPQPAGVRGGQASSGSVGETGTGSTGGPDGGPGGGPGGEVAYWPWETGPSDVPPPGPGDSAVMPAVTEPVPGRRWLRLGLVLGVVTLLVLGAILTYNLGRGRTPLGAEPAPTTPAPTTTTPAPDPVPLSGITATDLDPQDSAGNGAENPDETANAVDGDSSTGWSTLTYFQQLGPSGLKTGLGLTLDLGAEQEVAQVDLSFLGTPTTATVYTSDEDPGGIDGLPALGEVEDAGDEASVTPDEPVTTRYLVVWLTSLPPTDGGFSGGLREVVVLGG